MGIRTRFQVTGSGTLVDTDAPTGPVPVPSSKPWDDPERLGVWNVAGLVNMAEPGTRAEFIPVPCTPYQPNVKASRPSYEATHIRPTLSAFLNRLPYRPPWGWHPAPPPAIPAPRITGPGQGTAQPQRIFPGMVTDWPRVTPRYKTLGG